MTFDESRAQIRFKTRTSLENGRNSKCSGYPKAHDRLNASRNGSNGYCNHITRSRLELPRNSPKDQEVLTASSRSRRWTRTHLSGPRLKHSSASSVSHTFSCDASKYVLAASSCEKQWILPNTVILPKAAFLCSRRRWTELYQNSAVINLTQVDALRICPRQHARLWGYCACDCQQRIYRWRLYLVLSHRNLA